MEAEIISPIRQKLIESTLWGYFILRLIFLAVTISPDVPPDETTHFGICQVFSRILLLPENSPATYQFGLVTNIPWLYYWIMGKLLPLNVFGASDLLFLRLLNIPMACGTVYFTLKMLSLLTDSRLTRILLLAALTNTMMFTFLSASVSYDNLANLLAAVSLNYLAAHLKKGAGTMLAASVLCLLAGCLAKKTLLLLLAMLPIVVFIQKVRDFDRLFRELENRGPLSGRTMTALSLGIVFFLLLNVQLYGGNYFRYGALDPQMSTVLSAEAAMQYRLEARNRVFGLFREERISEKQALEMALQIAHPGDRDAAIYLIQEYTAQKQSGLNLMGPFRYAAVWTMTMLSGVYGIYAHLDMPAFASIRYLMLFIMLLAGTGFVLRWRPSQEGKAPFLLLMLGIMYGLFLMYYINYDQYLYFASTEISVQGRYIFPVLGTLYALASHYLLRLFGGEKARFAVTIIMALIFIASDFPLFLARATSEWFA